MNAFLKVSIAVSSIVISLNAHAGLFGKTDKLTCDSPESNNALSAYFRDSVTGTLQTNYITSKSAFNGKPIQLFIDKMNSIPINITNVRLLSQRSDTQVECLANISISVPSETLDVVKIMPDKLSSIKGNGYFLNESIGWESYYYKLVMSDDKKNISVTDLSGRVLASSLRNSAIMAVTHNDIVLDKKKEELEKAVSKYASLDASLNSVWNKFSSELRELIKSSQVKWVNEKTNKCGKISDAQSDATDIDTRIFIYNCQSAMTEARLRFFYPDFFDEQDYD